MIAPASLSILTTTFHEGRERNRAVGIWGAMGGAGGAAGVLLGGVLTDVLGWRWILFINVPIGSGRGVLRPAPASPRAATPRARRNFDLRGALSATVGLSLVVLGIVRTDVTGWGSPPDARPDRRRGRAAGRVPRDRGALRPRAADAAADLRVADAQRREHRRDAGRRRDVRDVVLRLALPPAGARLLADQGRARVPADDGLHRARFDARLARRDPDRRQAAAARRDGRPDRRTAAAHRTCRSTAPTRA